MSEIKISRAHGKTLKRARKGAEHIAEELDEEFGLTHEWDGDTLRFKRTGVSGHIEVGKKKVEIYVKLGLLLKVLGPRIEREIHRFCDENFGPAV
jgi:putative polyhydroxyalkanoate system protein